MNRVLFIHGIKQGGRGAAAVHTEWLDALRIGYAEADLAWPGDNVFDLAYYADYLLDLIDRSSSESLTAKSAGMPDDPFEEFSANVLAEILRESGLLTDEMVAAEFDTTTGPVEKSIQNWAWVRAIAAALDKNTRFDNKLIEVFLKEVHFYVNIDHVAQMVDTIVDQTLGTGPTVLVGHSLGSVVSYQATVRNANVCGHITLGSPLAIESIRAKLGLKKNAARSGWFNARDPEDVVALYPLDAKYFRTNPAIVNDNSIENETENQHGISGYLNKPSVARAIEVARTA